MKRRFYFKEGKEKGKIEDLILGKAGVLNSAIELNLYLKWKEFMKQLWKPRILSSIYTDNLRRETQFKIIYINIHNMYACAHKK